MSIFYLILDRVALSKIIPQRSQRNCYNNMKKYHIIKGNDFIIFFWYYTNENKKRKTILIDPQIDFFYDFLQNFYKNFCIILFLKKILNLKNILDKLSDLIIIVFNIEDFI